MKMTSKGSGPRQKVIFEEGRCSHRYSKDLLSPSLEFQSGPQERLLSAGYLGFHASGIGYSHGASEICFEIMASFGRV